MSMPPAANLCAQACAFLLSHMLAWQSPLELGAAGARRGDWQLPMSPLPPLPVPLDPEALSQHLLQEKGSKQYSRGSGFCPHP